MRREGHVAGKDVVLGEELARQMAIAPPSAAAVTADSWPIFMGDESAEPDFDGTGAHGGEGICEYRVVAHDGAGFAAAECAANFQFECRQFAGFHR
jgi:hypothetical protein